MRTGIILVLLVFATLSHAQKNELSRILSTMEALPPDLPSVTLAFPVGPANTYYFCRATKINRRQLLTAGHCVLEQRSGQWLLRDPFVYILANKKTTSKLLINKFHLHPLVTDQLVNQGLDFMKPGHVQDHQTVDLAILDLDTGLDDIPNAAIPLYLPAVGDTVRMMGYFCSTPHKIDPRYVTDPNFLSAPIVEVRKNHFQIDQFDLCPGDSGGPAFTMSRDGYELAGVLSFSGGFYDGKKYNPTSGFVRLDIDPVKSWLNDIVKP